jgi:hypothetical protein
MQGLIIIFLSILCVSSLFMASLFFSMGHYFYSFGFVLLTLTLVIILNYWIEG